MPQSIYTKMSDVLKLLVTFEEPIKIDEFAEHIRTAEIESFARWYRPEGKEDVVKTYCRNDSIKKVILFSAELELIKIDDSTAECKLTEYGKLAVIDNSKYQAQLAARLRKYMRTKYNLKLQQIKSAISDIASPNVPDRETIKNKLKEAPYNVTFSSDYSYRRLMYLLEKTDLLSSKITKVYDR